jgi:hypothetical protein
MDYPTFMIQGSIREISDKNYPNSKYT